MNIHLIHVKHCLLKQCLKLNKLNLNVDSVVAWNIPINAFWSLSNLNVSLIKRHFYLLIIIKFY